MGRYSSWLVPLSIALFSAGSAHAEEAEYTVAVKPVALTVGQEGPLELVFTPKAPWHWNKDYPAKIELAPPTGVKVARALLRQQDDDFKTRDSGVAIAFALTAIEPKAGSGTLKGKIGLCDDKVCIIKKVELTVPIVATR